MTFRNRKTVGCNFSIAIQIGLLWVQSWLLVKKVSHSTLYTLFNIPNFVFNRSEMSLSLLLILSLMKTRFIAELEIAMRESWQGASSTGVSHTECVLVWLQADAQVRLDQTVSHPHVSCLEAALAPSPGGSSRRHELPCHGAWAGTVVPGTSWAPPPLPPTLQTLPHFNTYSITAMTSPCVTIKCCAFFLI